MAMINRKLLSKKEKKTIFFDTLEQYFEEYSRILFVEADNVGSSQMQQIRKALRGKAVVLMGKNTMIRKCIRGLMSKKPELEVVLNNVKGNVGFVFTNEEPVEIRDLIATNRVAAPARPGSIAPCDVHVPAGPTGMEPTQTSFLQALNIPSKISRGQVEIISDVHLIVTGEKVGTSEATLLSKLGIKPFSYGLEVSHIYDNGDLYAASVLDLTTEDIVAQFKAGVARITAIALACHYPTVAAVPHVVMNGFKNILAISLATDYTCKETEKMKEFLENPEAFANLVAAAAPTETKAEEAAVESEEEEDDDMGFGLFD